MDYRIEAPHCLDWTLEITPLEEDCGDLSLRGMAHLNEKASPEAVFLADNGFSTVPVGANEEIVLKPKIEGAGEARGYHRPVLYSRTGDVVLVFMFKPGAPVDLLAVGPSEKCPEQVRGFIWHIENAEKDRVYKLEVRIGVLPVSSLDKVEQEYQRWSAGTASGQSGSLPASPGSFGSFTGPSSPGAGFARHRRALYGRR